MHEHKLVLLAHCIANLDTLVSQARFRDLPVEVVAKDDTLFDLIRQYDARYVVGVCCQRKIEKLTPTFCDLPGFLYVAVPAGLPDAPCFKASGVRGEVDMREYIHALIWLEYNGV